MGIRQMQRKTKSNDRSGKQTKQQKREAGTAGFPLVFSTKREIPFISVTYTNLPACPLDFFSRHATIENQPGPPVHGGHGFYFGTPVSSCADARAIVGGREKPPADDVSHKLLEV
ncbi:MAG: hypothetical protein IJT94_07025, partial [Oscillibacter sp.]|nr:hypothetical protein [Oscillibacter sp.]